MSVRAIDLFAGAGGIDEGLKQLDVDDVLGIELDDSACATREAAGHRTLQADVSQLDPLEVACDKFGDAGSIDLLAGGPPCPSFSSAGKREGVKDLPAIYKVIDALGAGDEAPEFDWHDDRSALVTEPLRWALELEPRFLFFEQVPPVLPVWERFARVLQAYGWAVWAGVVEAERYGVPQTRERAILIADRERASIQPPRPTHQRYVKGEPARHEVTMEGEVLPWVSIAEALTAAGLPLPGEAQARDSGPGAEREPRALTEPSYTIRANGSGSHPSGVRWALKSGNSVAGGERAQRELTEPSVTVTTRADNNCWVYDRRQQNRDGSPVPPVPLTSPAPTLTANGLAKSTHQWSDGEDRRPLTLEEAAVLQSFIPTYSFQGGKPKQFQQVGNAVPPLLARAVLTQLLSPVLPDLALATSTESEGAG